MVYVLLLVQQIIASTTHIVGKVVVDRVDPAVVVLLRSTIASVVLLTWVRLRGTWHVLHRRDYARIFFLGFISVPVNQWAFLYGLKYSTPPNAALLYALTPALLVVAQRLFLKERVRKRRLVAVGVAFVGVTVILSDRGIDLAARYLYGNVFIFLAVIAWVAYTLLAKRFITRYGVVESTALSMAAGAVLSAIVVSVEPSVIASTRLDLGMFGAIVYLGAVSTAIGYALWYSALNKISANRVAVFQNVQPVLTTVLAVLFLSQSLTPQFIVGGVITLAGVLLTQLW